MSESYLIIWLELATQCWRTPWSQNTRTRLESVGKLAPSKDFKVQIRHTEENRLCRTNEEGEVYAITPFRMIGYWHEKDNQSSFWVIFFSRKKIDESFET